jgi:hypothetical protein
VRKAIDAVMQKGMEEVLLANDQLRREMASHHVFYGFYEHPICFPPTYKYDLDTDNFDSAKTARIPSWTDRILIKTKDSFKVRSYDSCQIIKFSDHKPVIGIFEINI